MNGNRSLVVHGNTVMVVLVQNDPLATPGILTEVLEKAGLAFKILQPFAGDRLEELTDLTAVVVVGGAMSVNEIQKFPFLVSVKKFILRVVETKTPCLGICLGAQLLAEVLGGKIRRHSNGERGCLLVSLTEEGATDPLFQRLPKQFFTVQSHDDSFELPMGASHLASSRRCRFQAFRWRKFAYGIQFHPEANLQIVSLWDNLRKSQGQFRDAFNQRQKSCLSTSLTIFDNFLRIIQFER